MIADEARTLFLDHCPPGDRGALQRHGETAAVDALLKATAFIESEARRYAAFYSPHSDGRNTFVIFADMVSDLTAERVNRHWEQAHD